MMKAAELALTWLAKQIANYQYRQLFASDDSGVLIVEAPEQAHSSWLLFQACKWSIRGNAHEQLRI
jgi:hypothetical protein